MLGIIGLEWEYWRNMLDWMGILEEYARNDWILNGNIGGIC